MIAPSPLYASPYVQVHYQGRRATVTIDLGTRCTVRNLPDYQVAAFVKLQLIRLLKRYVNHRQQILRHHGGHHTHYKELTIASLQRKLGASSRWQAEQIPHIIDRILPELRAIAPGQRSDYYRQNQILLQDLQDYSYRAMDQIDAYATV